MSPPEPLRLLFIARAFPPTVGGMENMAHHLSTNLDRHAELTTLVNRRGKRALPIFLPYALIAGLRLAREVRPHAIHVADALLAPVGLALKRLTGLPVTASVHGLDLTYRNRPYQIAVPNALARLDLIVANSRSTEALVPDRCGPGVPTAAVPLGVNPLPEPDAGTLRALRRRIRGDGDADGCTLLTVGRLIERKGVSWFVERVLPRLPDRTTYVVVGEGPERQAAHDAARRGGVADRVRLLGRVSDGELAAAYRSADVFVMPNVPVAGDVEGFGLVALEAAASGLPVVASRLEGITEAIEDGANGVLVEPGDADAFATVLNDLLSLTRAQRSDIGARAAAYTDGHFNWDRTARRYIDLIGRVAA